MVDITIDEVKKTKIFDKILLSSDDDKILKIGEKNSNNQRPKKISNSAASTESALIHAINKLNLHQLKGIFIFQVTSPLRKHTTIKSFYNFCKKILLKML